VGLFGVTLGSQRDQVPMPAQYVNAVGGDESENQGMCSTSDSKSAPGPDHVVWNWDGQSIRVGFDRLGTGPTVLLLPALSSISTRREMRPLQERLAPTFATLSIDWPGFGDEPRPPIHWQPEAYAAFLRHVLAEVAPHPLATIAAGHAASYVLAAAAASRKSAGFLCLIAPTWRGPLPTMLGERLTVGAWIARVGDLPVFGPLLYRLNVNQPVVRMMARGHVYTDPDWLEGERLGQKMAVVRSGGARHASIRFVTGMLDPMTSRETFIATATKIEEPILVLYGAATPRRSKAEIEALAALPNVRSIELPSGKLSIHEEFPDAVAEAVRAFVGHPALDDSTK
jgi:Alpha/beta hydrolase family